VNAVCRLNAGEPQFCRPVPRKPTFLMESLTREGLYTAMDDHQPSHKSSAKYDSGLCIISLLLVHLQCFDTAGWVTGTASNP